MKCKIYVTDISSCTNVHLDIKNALPKMADHGIIYLRKMNFLPILWKVILFVWIILEICDQTPLLFFLGHPVYHTFYTWL